MVRYLIKFFAPRSVGQWVAGFAFWIALVQITYLLVLAAFGQLGSAPIAIHMAIGAIAVAPFLIISQLMLRFQLQLQRRLSIMARQDQLTGLPNRRRFFEQVAPIIAKTPAALLMIDIDHFKKINDRYGHGMGDDCLQQMAKHLLAIVGDAGLVSRLGGEDFGVMLMQEDRAGALAFGEAIARGIDLVVGSDGTAIQVTNSVGIVMGQPGEDLSELLSEADQALYAAKSAGRAQAKLYVDNSEARSKAG